MAIITISSDIGHNDYIVAAIKGQLLQLKTNISIVDVCHNLSASNFPEAAYLCSSAFTHFPEKSFHLIYLHFYENKNQNILFVEYKNQYIICADNGLISMLIPNLNEAKIFSLNIEKHHLFLSTTQQIAKCIEQIILQQNVHLLVSPCSNYIVKNALQPTISEDRIQCQIIFIDKFNNVVINLTQQVFEQYGKRKKFSIVFKRNEEIVELSHNYFDVKDGEKLAYFNSAGYMELALNKGNMASLFGLQSFNELDYQEGKQAQKKLFYNTVTIFFK